MFPTRELLLVYSASNSSGTYKLWTESSWTSWFKYEYFHRRTCYLLKKTRLNMRSVYFSDLVSPRRFTDSLLLHQAAGRRFTLLDFFCNYHLTQQPLCASSQPLSPLWLWSQVASVVGLYPWTAWYQSPKSADIRIQSIQLWTEKRETTIFWSPHRFFSADVSPCVPSWTGNAARPTSQSLMSCQRVARLRRESIRKTGREDFDTK